MIIGISGKKQHGKDSVANIIQYLAFDKRYPGHSHTLESFSNEVYGWKNLESTWHRKQFASKLKQIVALLIGCKVEQLEDSKFKETLLGDMGKIWYWTHKQGNVRIGGIYSSEEEAISKHLHSDTIRLMWEILTPRRLLQLMGTECSRQIIHPNIWINALMADYKWDKNTEYTTVRGTNSATLSKRDYPGLPKWIVTDVRFPNEARAIKDRGGIVIRVNREKRTSDRWQEMFPDITVINPDGWDRQNYEFSWSKEFITLDEYKNRILYSTCRFNNKGRDTKGLSSIDYVNAFFKLDEHESETALDNYTEFDAIITNNAGFSELEEKVKNTLLPLKLY